MVPEFSAFAALLKRLDDRRAARRLHRDHPRTLEPDPAHGLHLVESLPHPDQAHAAPGGIDDHVRQPRAPGASELLPQLVGHRLLALDAVRLLERGDVEPTLAVLMLGDVAAAVGNQPVNLAYVGA